MSDVLSSEIDISEFLREAEAIERMASSQPDPVPGKKRKRRPSTATAVDSPSVLGESETTTPTVPTPMSPEFPLMIEGVVTVGTRAMSMKFDWDDPGPQWHRDFSGALARVIHHYVPVGGENTDLLVIGGYLMMYISANTMLPRDRGTRNVVPFNEGRA